MTLIFNPDKYKELLTAYIPKLIKSEAENEQALRIVEGLMHSERTPEEEEFYQLLITLIEKFEEEYYQPIPENNPVSMLLFILEASESRRDDLVAVLGTEYLVDNILNGQEKINTEQAHQLGEFFHVESSLFLE